MPKRSKEEEDGERSVWNTRDHESKDPRECTSWKIKKITRSYEDGDLQ